MPDDTKATTGIAVWDRQPSETSRQFAVFRAYRNANPLHRSLAKVAQQLGCSETYLQRLSARHQWVARVDAFDAEQDRVEQRQRTRRIKDMNARHAELAAAALAKVRERIESLDAQSLRPAEVARLLEVASRAERIARGLLPDEPFVHEPPHAFRADAIKAMLKAEGLI